MKLIWEKDEFKDGRDDMYQAFMTFTPIGNIWIVRYDKNNFRIILEHIEGYTNCYLESKLTKKEAIEFVKEYLINLTNKLNDFIK